MVHQVQERRRGVRVVPAGTCRDDVAVRPADHVVAAASTGGALQALDAVLAAGADPARVGDEVLSVARLVDANPTLRRNLADPSREGADKTALAERLFTGKVGDGIRSEIDADGALVTPGFVDVHTHYDGQATWDQRLQPSSLQGVVLSRLSR